MPTHYDVQCKENIYIVSFLLHSIKVIVIEQILSKSGHDFVSGKSKNVHVQNWKEGKYMYMLFVSIYVMGKNNTKNKQE